MSEEQVTSEAYKQLSDSELKERITALFQSIKERTEINRSEWKLIARYQEVINERDVEKLWEQDPRLKTNIGDGLALTIEFMELVRHRFSPGEFKKLESATFVSVDLRGRAWVMLNDSIQTGNIPLGVIARMRHTYLEQVQP